MLGVTAQKACDGYLSVELDTKVLDELYDWFVDNPAVTSIISTSKRRYCQNYILIQLVVQLDRCC